MSQESIRDLLIGQQTDRSPENTDRIIRYFQATTIDNTPHLLEQSYRLRYQVYCIDRKFLPAADYPSELEVDEFDRDSVHVGAIDNRGGLVSTARLVHLNVERLPLFRHCSIYQDETELYDSGNKILEVSRLSVSRNYNRREGDGFYSLQGLKAPANPEGRRADQRYHGGGEVVMTVVKGLYQASKRMGASHWLVATEKSLQRLFARYRFGFRQIGPESDYFGPVAPYLMNLRAFDKVISTHELPALDDFLVGLEAQSNPGSDTR